MVFSSITTMARTRVLCPERLSAAYTKLDWLGSLTFAFSRVWIRSSSVQRGWKEAEGEGARGETREGRKGERGKKILTGQRECWLMGVNLKQHQYESSPHNHKLAGVADVPKNEGREVNELALSWSLKAFFFSLSSLSVQDVLYWKKDNKMKERNKPTYPTTHQRDSLAQALTSTPAPRKWQHQPVARSPQKGRRQVYWEHPKKFSLDRNTWTYPLAWWDLAEWKTRAIWIQSWEAGREFDLNRKIRRRRRCCSGLEFDSVAEGSHRCSSYRRRDCCRWGIGCCQTASCPQLSKWSSQPIILLRWRANRRKCHHSHFRAGMHQKKGKR